jgi:hypothetical protein
LRESFKTIWKKIYVIAHTQAFNSLGVKQMREANGYKRQSIFHIIALISMMTSLLSATDYTSTLPPDFKPFEEFEKDFALGGTSTEQFHPITKHLSQTMHKNITEGMELLLDVDQEVVKGFDYRNHIQVA